MIKYDDIKKANESIKTTDIKGKEYAEVNQRIKAFRMVYPDGFIETMLVSNENGVCVFRAEVGYYFAIADYEGRVGRTERRVLGVGTAYEKEGSTFINKTSYIENCETSAVGRALGMAGFGIDTSVASAEEVQNAINNQVKQTYDPPKETQGDETRANTKQIIEIKELVSNIPKMLEYYGLQSIFDLTAAQADEIIRKKKGNRNDQ